METFEYTLTTDAFSFGSQQFASQSITFTRAFGQTEVSLAGQSFDGVALDKAIFPRSTGYPFGYQGLFLQTASTDGLISIGGYGYLFPTISNPTITVGPNIALWAVMDTPSGWQSQVIRGTITETALNLPDPPILALFITGIALSYLVARHRRRWGSRGH